MRDVRLDNITPAVLASFNGLPDARQRVLVQTLIAHLHSFAKEVQLTHDEWRGALSFLHRVGEMSSESRSEFSLLSDVVGLSSLVDLLASSPKATPGSVLGPFHTVGSPWCDNPAQLVQDNPGRPVVLRGRVLGTDGQPLSSATVDFWQNADNGMYWQMDDTQPTDNLRCQLKVDAQGVFEIVTIQPMPYQIPTDGPVWFDLVAPAARGSWRPAHFHIIITAPEHRTLVTELFEQDDPYLDVDAVFGVRNALIAPYQEVHDAQACQRLGLPGSSYRVIEFDIRLSK